MPRIDPLPRITRGMPNFRQMVGAYHGELLPDFCDQLNEYAEYLQGLGFGSYTAISTTELTLGLGEKVLQIEAEKSFAPGQYVLIADASAPMARRMEGVVTAHNPTTGALTVEVERLRGSGQRSDWIISVTAAFEQLPPSVQYRAVSASTAITAADWGCMIAASSPITLTLDSAVNLGAGWQCVLRNDGAADVTVSSASGDELIDGVASGYIPPGASVLIMCTGASFTATKVSGISMRLLTSGTSTSVPLGIRSFKAILQGGGQSGGHSNQLDRAGKGGDSGSTVECVLRTNPGQSLTYAIGAGGAVVSPSGSSSVAGTPGGATSLTVGSITVTAPGGGMTSSAVAPSGSLVSPQGAGLYPVGQSQMSFPAGSRLSQPGADNGSTPTGFGVGGYGVGSSMSSQPGGHGCIFLEF